MGAWRKLQFLTITEPKRGEEGERGGRGKGRVGRERREETEGEEETEGLKGGEGRRGSRGGKGKKGRKEENAKDETDSPPAGNQLQDSCSIIFFLLSQVKVKVSFIFMYAVHAQHAAHTKFQSCQPAV